MATELLLCNIGTSVVESVLSTAHDKGTVESGEGL